MTTYNVVEYSTCDSASSHILLLRTHDLSYAKRFIREYGIFSDAFTNHATEVELKDIAFSSELQKYGDVVHGYTLHRSHNVSRKLLIFQEKDKTMQSTDVNNERIRWVSHNITNNEKTYHNTKDKAMTDALDWMFQYQYAAGDIQPEAMVAIEGDRIIIGVMWPDDPDEEDISCEIYPEEIKQYRVVRKEAGNKIDVLLVTENFAKAIMEAERLANLAIANSYKYSMIYNHYSDEIFLSDGRRRYKSWNFQYIYSNNKRDESPLFAVEDAE